MEFSAKYYEHQEKAMEHLKNSNRLSKEFVQPYRDGGDFNWGAFDESVKEFHLYIKHAGIAKGIATRAINKI